MEPEPSSSYVREFEVELERLINTIKESEQIEQTPKELLDLMYEAAGSKLYNIRLLRNQVKGELKNREQKSIVGYLLVHPKITMYGEDDTAAELSGKLKLPFKDVARHVRYIADIGCLPVEKK